MATPAPPQAPKDQRKPTSKLVARLRHLAWEWQEVVHVAFFLAGAIVAVFLSRLFGENGGQAPLSFIADLAQMAAATSLVALLAWLVKRALLGDLPDGEVRSLYQQLRKGPDEMSEAAFKAIALDSAGSLACLALVIALWSVLY